MRYILTSLLLCVTIFDYAQISDDFSDGDFISNPTWSGEVSNFEIDANNQLHLIAPAVTDTMFLVTPNTMVNNTEWTFWVKLDFGTSAFNLARVYLMSDQPDLKQNLNGYFVQIGNTEDEVSLYKQTGTTVQEIINGTDGFVGGDPVVVRVKVTRTNTGNWTLMADSTGNSNFVYQGSVNDITHLSTSYFGVFCKYTSTRSQKFYFDDFEIQSLIGQDTLPPQITNVQVVSNNTLHLLFNENIDNLSAETESNYVVDNTIGTPSQAHVLSTNTQMVELTFSNSFQEGIDYILSVDNIQDDSGNVMSDTMIHFVYNAPNTYKDVIITEIMADPTPVEGLPEAEYLELYNNTTQIISLENWTISDGTSTITLPDTLFPPGTHLLLYDPQSNANFNVSNSCKVSLPTLNNSGDVIILADNSGLAIDSVSYDLKWYQNVSKALGGWSLELMNYEASCHDPSNWRASEDPSGGTPGYQNSIFTAVPDTQKPKIEEIYIENDSIVFVVFNKTITDGSIAITPSLDHVSSISGSSLMITLSAIDPNQYYQITLLNYTDCWGNSLDKFVYTFGIPEIVKEGDVIINEVLFNPDINGADYVEVVNVSEKILSVSDIQLANIEDGMINNVHECSNKTVLFFPGEFLVLTKDSLAVMNHFPNYRSGSFIEMEMPAFNNDSGTVILLTNNILLDKFSYSEDLHFELIDDLNGKALERLSFDLPTQSIDNWHTASEKAGWGTPGYRNSQSIYFKTAGKISLNNPIFSPDNDGYQDVLEIVYELEAADNIMDIVVYNSLGQPVRELKDNFYAGKAGLITWDGINDEGQKANVGTYIIGITLFDLDGNVKRYKLVGVLASRL